MLTLSQYICGACGHGIHSHVDYVSMIVNHYPATQCAAYVQKVSCSPLLVARAHAAYAIDTSDTALHVWNLAFQPRHYR